MHTIHTLYTHYTHTIHTLYNTLYAHYTVHYTHANKSFMTHEEVNIHRCNEDYINGIQGDLHWYLPASLLATPTIINWDPLTSYRKIIAVKLSNDNVFNYL